MNNIEKALKYIVWTGLIAICFTPLVIGGEYYFPFIVPKTVVFKVIVSVIFLAYLCLAVLDKKYRIKFNLVLALFLFYLLIVSLSSFLNGTFYFSFWGNNERSEGLILLLHLFLFLIVLTGFLNPEFGSSDINSKLNHSKKWLVVFDASFLSGILVSLYSLGQYFNLEKFVAAGDRLTATIGNAGYVAGYLIFNVFWGLILLFFRKDKNLRWYYGLGILLQIFIILNTLTRGAIIALAFSLVVLIGYLFFFRLKKRRILKNAVVLFLMLTIVFVGLVFANKNKSWVQGNTVLERITSISINAVTAQTRLMTWKSSYRGFKEKPLLGYGYENFYQVFDKYFNPKIYRKTGSVVWFDRAHNIIFDRLITGGIIGLTLYLSMLFIPFICLWRHHLKKKETGSDCLIPLLLTLAMITYFIQNLFIFEALVTYIPLFIMLAFLSYYCPSWKDDFFQTNKSYIVLLTFSIIGFIPFLFVFTIKPAMANREFIDTLILAQENRTKEAYEKFIKFLDKQGPNNQEYRQHFGEFITVVVNNQQNDYDFQLKATMEAEKRFDKQIAEKPQSARNYLMFIRFLNRTYQFDIERLNKAIALFNQAIILSPTRPMLYHEVAYSQVYLGRFYQSQKKNEEAEKLFDQAIENMQKSIDLNNQVTESYINMCMSLFAAGRADQVQTYLDRMDDLKVDYHLKDCLGRMASTAINAKEYQWTAKFYKELTEIEPDNPDNFVNLALSYAYLGQKEEAIKTAKEVEKFGDEYDKQSDLFIQDVLNGVYDK